MIKLPTPNELEELRAIREPFCLTIYMSLIDANAVTDTNRIEVKKMLQEAEVALLSAGMKRRDIDKMLASAKLFAEEPELWRAHHERLAMFIYPNFFRHYTIPESGDTGLLTVGDSFQLEPITEAMKDNRQYYILTLGHKNVRVYEGDHYGIKPIELKHFPANMKETLNIDEYPESRETHSITPAGKGSEADHGQYNVAQTDKAMLLEFFRRIDRYLHDFLFSHQKPLVIAGVDYLLPIYRKVNTYPGLVSQSITGNQDNPDLQSLKDKAWNLVWREE